MVDFLNPLDNEIKERYTSFEQERKDYLTRGYTYSKITLPYILPENDDVSSSELQVDYSGAGAEYVNHLSNVYMNEMFPTHRCFYKLQMPFTELQEVADSQGSSKAEIEANFALAEKETRWKFEQKGMRNTYLDAMKHLMIVGNTCLYVPKDKLSMNYGLDQYVVHRDVSGRLLEVITEDHKVIGSFDTDMQTKILATMDNIDDIDLNKYKVRIFTWIRRDPSRDGVFIASQAIEGVNLPDTMETYNEDVLPWIPLFWNRVRKEVYGRGIVEDYYGSFYGLSILSEALITAGAIMTDFKFLVRPGSQVDPVTLNNSPSGTYHYGLEDDVNLIENGKARDLQFIMELINEYRRRLGKIFLVLSTQMRDAERVTAEENRLRALELNKAHGGVFGNLSQSLQKRSANLLLAELDILLKDTGIEPVVMTGLDAMGRASENEKLRQFADDLAIWNNVPDEFRARLKVSDTMSLTATGRDVEPTIIKTEAEFQQDQQNAQAAQAQEAAGQAMLDKAEPEQIAEATQGG